VPENRVPAVIAHRGASGYRPEHTRAAFELAFVLGADAVEPDLVATRDGVLVVRHENEISGTTDVASRPEFAGRRSHRVIDGEALTGWFTEDFTWAELATLRSRERLPHLRPANVGFDGSGGILRLRDLLEIIDAASVAAERALGLVAEIKHATYFSSIGLPLHELLVAELSAAGWNSGDGRLTVESFEASALDAVRRLGLRSKNIFLLEASGSPADLIARHGSAARDFASFLTTAGLAELSGATGGISVDGISVDKALILPVVAEDGAVIPSTVVADAHEQGLEVFTWTLRPENEFLSEPFRRGLSPSVHGDWAGEFALIIRSGVDGVFADHPDLALNARADVAGGE
jgi:glycerophosphoryl diester phosphodiesterase